MRETNRRVVIAVVAVIGLVIVAVILGLLRSAVQGGLGASPAVQRQVEVYVEIVPEGDDLTALPMPLQRPAFTPLPTPTPRPTFTPLPMPTPLPTPTPTPTPKPIQLTLERRVNDGVVVNLAYSYDGKLLAILSTTGIQLYDADTLSKLRSLELRVHPRHATQEGYVPLAFSPDGQMLASVDETASKLLIWRVADGALLHTIQAVNLPRDLVFSADSKSIIYTDGPRILVQSLDGSQSVRVLSGHTDDVIRIAISADGQWLASASKDYTVRRWSLGGNESNAQVIAQTWADRVSLSKDGAFLGVARFDETFGYAKAEVLRASDKTVALSLEDTSNLSFVHTEPELLFTVRRKADGIHVWQMPEVMPLPFPHPLIRFSKVAVAPTGREVAFAYEDGTVGVVLLQASLWAKTTTLPFSDDGGHRWIWSEDGEWAAQRVPEGILIWDVTRGEAVQLLPTNLLESPVILSRKNNVLATEYLQDRLTLWSLTDGSRVRSYEGRFISYDHEADMLALENGKGIFIYSGLTRGELVDEIKLESISFPSVYIEDVILIMNRDVLSLWSPSEKRLKLLYNLPPQRLDDKFFGFGSGVKGGDFYIIYDKRLIRIGRSDLNLHTVLDKDFFCDNRDRLQHAVADGESLHVFANSGCVLVFSAKDNRLLYSARIFPSPVRVIARPERRILFVQGRTASRLVVDDLTPRQKGSMQNYSAKNALNLSFAEDSMQATAFFRSGYYDVFQFPGWNKTERSSDAHSVFVGAEDVQVDSRGLVALPMRQGAESIVLWQIPKREAITVPDASPRIASLSLDGQLLIATVKPTGWSPPQEIGFWRTDNGLLVRKVPIGDSRGVAALALSVDGSTLAMLEPSGRVNLRAALDGSAVGTLPATQEYLYLGYIGASPNVLRFSGDGRLLFAFQRDQERRESDSLPLKIVGAWQVPERRLLDLFPLFGTTFESVHAFGVSTGDLVAVALSDRIIVADTQGRSRGSIPLPYHIPPVKLVFSADEKQLVSLHPDGVMFVWQIKR